MSITLSPAVNRMLKEANHSLKQAWDIQFQHCPDNSPRSKENKKGAVQTLISQNFHRHIVEINTNKHFGKELTKEIKSESKSTGPKEGKSNCPQLLSKERWHMNPFLPHARMLTNLVLCSQT